MANFKPKYIRAIACQNLPAQNLPAIIQLFHVPAKLLGPRIPSPKYNMANYSSQHLHQFLPIYIA
jgi:hypothetical protein